MRPTALVVAIALTLGLDLGHSAACPPGTECLKYRLQDDRFRQLGDAERLLAMAMAPEDPVYTYRRTVRAAMPARFSRRRIVRLLTHSRWRSPRDPSGTMFGGTVRFLNAATITRRPSIVQIFERTVLIRRIDHVHGWVSVDIDGDPYILERCLDAGAKATLCLTSQNMFTPEDLASDASAAQHLREPVSR